MPVILKVINMCQLTQTLNGHLNRLMSNFVYAYLPYHKFITIGSLSLSSFFSQYWKKKKIKENSNFSLLVGLNLVFLFNPILLEKDLYWNIIDIKKLYTFNVENLMNFSSVQFSLSHVQLCNAMDCSTPGLLVHHQLLEFTQTHVHCGSAGKESACNVGYLDSIPGLGRSPGEGKGYSLQYSGLENSMDFIALGSQRIRHNGVTHFHVH